MEPVLRYRRYFPRDMRRGGCRGDGPEVLDAVLETEDTPGQRAGLTRKLRACSPGQLMPEHGRGVQADSADGGD